MPRTKNVSTRENAILELVLREPNKRAFLPPMGGAQTIVMCAADALGNDAYGVKLGELIETWLGKRMNLGQVYATADSLKDLGLLDTQLRPSPHGKGRAVTVYHVSKRGRIALRAVLEFNLASTKEQPPNGSRQRAAAPKEVVVA